MHFPITRGFPVPRQVVAVHAVDDVSFAIAPGETLGLVGESGCGKTTVGRTLLRLYEPTAGEVYFEGQEILHLSQSEFLPYRRRSEERRVGKECRSRASPDPYEE